MSRETASNCTTTPLTSVIGVMTMSHHFRTPDADRSSPRNRPRPPPRAAATAAAACRANLPLEELGDRAVQHLGGIDFEEPQTLTTHVDKAAVEVEDLHAVADVLDDQVV